MYGGLGDHLFATPVARLAKETGLYQEVWVSNQSEFRHPDYKRLVWEMNPYIDGFTDEKGLFDYIDILEEFKKKPGINLIDALLMRYGIDDGQFFHEPELYFKPKIRDDLQNAVIYDPNYVSNVGLVSSGSVEAFFKKHQIKVDYQLKVRGQTNFPIGSHQDILETPSIEDYCSVIVSCKAFYCLTSGGATLAAALGKPCTAFYGYGQGQIFHHSKRHTYQYAGSLNSDFKRFKDNLSQSTKKKLPFLHSLLRKLFGPRYP